LTILINFSENLVLALVDVGTVHNVSVVSLDGRSLVLYLTKSIFFVVRLGIVLTVTDICTVSNYSKLVLSLLDLAGDGFAVNTT